MKKLLLALFVISTAQFSFAQITLTNSNTATIGDSFYRAEELNPSSSLQYMQSGANQTWDFSSFVAWSGETFGVVDIVNPSAVALHGSDFTHADFAMGATNENDTTYSFYVSDTSRMEWVGIGGPFEVQEGLSLQVTMPFSDYLTMLEFPATFGSTFTDTLFVDNLIKDPTYQDFIDSARVKRFLVADSEIDAWGTVTLPSGTYSCLREHRVEMRVDSAWAQSSLLPYTFDTVAFVEVVTEHVYNWYGEDYNLPLVEIRTDDQGGFNSVHFRSTLAECCAGVEENELANRFSVYPNPASDIINVITTLNDQTFINMYDMTGRQVLSESISQAQNQFSITGLSNGMYLYRIQDANGKLIKAEKIVVKK